MTSNEKWYPGSFTKNFSWGPESGGLRQLYDTIRVGFDYKVKPVSRIEFRSRVARLNRPDFIPLNFFLLNKIENGKNILVVDELVFQALTSRHNGQFDKLALFAFNLSQVGHWKGAKPFQSEPALWAKRYVQRRVSLGLGWDASGVDADDIEDFLLANPNYTGRTTRKLATNLNYLFKIGRLREFSRERLERWWLSALFLTLDRFSPQPPDQSNPLALADLHGALADSGFWDLGGPRTKAKEVSAGYFSTLYLACAGLARFDQEAMSERESELVPHHRSNEEPSLNPVGVLHPSNPNARNTIPHAARVLAQYLAGFEIFEAEDLDSFDVESFVKKTTAEALKSLKERGIKPSIGSEDLAKMMRGE